MKRRVTCVSGLSVAALGSLLVSAVFGAAADPCDREDSNGCTTPFGVGFPYKEDFTPSCNRHDICYSCAEAHGLNRTDCDLGFLKDMVETCGQLPAETLQVIDPYLDNDFLKVYLERVRLEIQRVCRSLSDLLVRSKSISQSLHCDRGTKYLECVNQANVVYTAVKAFGGLYYEDEPASFCNKAFVPNCLPRKR